VTRTDNSLATALLVSRIAGDGHDTLKASEYWSLPCPPGELLGKATDDMAGMGIDESLSDRIVALFDRSVALAFELDRYEQAGISTVTVHDAGYPARLRERLGDRAPALLHVAGDVNLLCEPGVGVVGSRGVDEDGAQVATAVAEWATSLELSVVSGGARGVDQLAMNTAHQAGGKVVGILADSLTRQIARAGARKALLNGDTVLATPYGPEAPFSVGTAMGRNKVIYALSTLTVVVASDRETGGTWAGAIEALRGGFGRVAVWRGPGEGSGNAHLVRRGATPFDNVDQFDEILAEPDEPVVAPPEPSQETLFTG
jgi:predicted Rossmann fold nucleotide-binding protein DprA/Smf involved in DNA uptake|tara:strand:- start:70 stop:1014 length:945 start_codon:yes stop_codon:yes gene_type:complete